MTEIHGDGLLPPVQDDLTIPQFFLDSHHSTRPIRKHGIPWLIDDTTGRKIGFEELHARTFGLANSLSSRYGIQENDVVAIFSPNHVDYPVAIWAVHRLGAIVSGANPSFNSEELLNLLTVTKASLIISHSSSYQTALSAAQSAGISSWRIIVLDDSPSAANFGTVESLVQDGLRSEPSFVERKLNPGEARTKIAFLNVSSGTTGRPKAVMISHYGPIINVVQTAVFLKINENYCSWEEKRYRPGDVALGVLPMFHIYGLVMNLMFTLYCGMTLVVIPKFNFVGFLNSVQKYRIQHLMLVPPQIVLLCKHPAVKDYDLSHVRHLVCGAAPLSAELMKQVVNILPNAQIGQGYGLTESVGTVSTLSPLQKIGVTGSSGQLLPGVIARVVKPDGSLAGYNEPGELRLNMPCLALGYLDNDAATKETFVDGWLHTGDEVMIDQQKEIYIVDRLKEILKVKGFQVAPAELEGCILDHPDVADTCVVGVPDEYSGEVPMAFVVLHAAVARDVERHPLLVDQIKASIMKHVADNKVLYKHLTGGVEFVDIIPKNPSGKLLRRILRERARELRTKARPKL